MAHSNDLRLRVVRTYLDGEGTLEEIANRFQVGRDFVFRMVDLYRKTGSVEKKPYGGGRQSILGKNDGYNKLLELYQEDNTLTNQEYAFLFAERFGINLSASSISRGFKKLKKKKKKSPSTPKNN